MTCKLSAAEGAATVRIVLSDPMEAVTAVGDRASFSLSFSLSDDAVPTPTLAFALALVFVLLLLLAAIFKVTTLFPLCPVNFLQAIATVLLVGSSCRLVEGAEYLVYLLRSSCRASYMEDKEEE